MPDGLTAHIATLESVVLAGSESADSAEAIGLRSVPVGSPTLDLPDDEFVDEADATRRALTRGAGGAAAALGLPLVLFLVLRPERFGITPNSLDPIFYTGYAINFDDIAGAVGDRHYMVSRWTSYLPNRIATVIAGPHVGRLLLRWIIAAAGVATLWRLRPAWSRGQRLVAGTVLVASPIYMRAILTDYVEYTVVGLGVCTVAVGLRPAQTLLSSVVLGVLLGAVAIANPFGLLVAAGPIVHALAVGWPTWRQRAIAAAAIGAAAIALAGAGLVWFRWRYGIGNVYEPTVSFLQNPPGPDELKSPRREWLGAFTWIYAPLILLAVATFGAARRWLTLDRVDVGALALCGVYYVFQWFDQFVRDGNGLEISYYWSFGYPSFGIALALVVGRALDGARTRSSVAVAVGVGGISVIGVPAQLHLPGGLWLVVAAVPIAGLLAVAVRASGVSAAGALIGAILLVQIGAPNYDPAAYHAFDLSPRYDRIAWQAGNRSDDLYDEVLWVTRELDRLSDDAAASFLPATGEASVVVATYAPHVRERLLSDDGRIGLSERGGVEIALGTRPVLVVLGPPVDVAALLSELPPGATVAHDSTHASGLGFRLVVARFADRPLRSVTVPVSVFEVANGTPTTVDVTARAGLDSPGFVTFGPYLDLRPGRYRATLAFHSDAPDGSVVGAFDVSGPGGVVASTSLLSSRVGAGTVTLTFDVEPEPEPSPGRWEFRTQWNGTGDIEVGAVTLLAEP